MTANPNGAWVAQQARNLLLVLGEPGRRVRFLLRDHDTKFCHNFDDRFRSEDAEVLLTPVQAPKANAYAERWLARSVPSAWTGSSSSGEVTCSRCSGSTSSTTTGIVPTGRWGWNRLTHPPF